MKCGRLITPKYTIANYKTISQPKAQRLNKKLVCSCVKYNGGSMIVWGC